MRTRASNSGWVSSTRPLSFSWRKCRLMTGAGSPSAAASSPARRGGDAGRPAPQKSCRRGRSIEPLFRGEAARLVPRVRRHPCHGHAEGPDMAFPVAGAIGAIAVELGVGLLQNLRARLARALAMRVDVLALRQLDVNRLRILAADGF